MALQTAANPIDYENGSAQARWQYQDFDTAWDTMTAGDLDRRIEFRKDGGGDSDFIELNFLQENDLMTIVVNQSEPDTMVEYYVSDPNRFPIYEFRRTDQDEANFTITFAVVTPGAYYFHTGQGFGDTFMNYTFSRVNVSPPPEDKDGNNAPAEKVLLTSGVAHSENAGNPWDPSDFFYIPINPTLQLNKYLTINIETEETNTIQWELYDSEGIQRLSLAYLQDTILSGSGNYSDKRIEDNDDYVVRVWMQSGFGQYTLTLTVLSYENDQDNSYDEAKIIQDNDVVSGDVNRSYDTSDYYKIYMTVGQPIWVRMVPEDGDADVFVYDANHNQKAVSRTGGLVVEDKIGYEKPTWDWVGPSDNEYYSFQPEEDGWVYIVVKTSFEQEFLPTTPYSMRVWINYWPHISNNALRNYHLDEDTVDTGFNISTIFGDTDEDPLTFELDMSYNDSLIDIQMEGDDRLRIVPAANASGFHVTILLNATDPDGLWINFTSNIYIAEVNDAPYVNASDIPDEIQMPEDKVISGINITKAFRDVDDDYDTWTFTANSTDHINVQLDQETWWATFTPLEDNWFGKETFNVTCIDKGGLTATIQITINMVEINDAPFILRYIAPFDLPEEETTSFDLVNGEGGPYFGDIEGDTLSYVFENNGSITVTIEGGILTLTGQKDFTGTVSSLVIRAVDELGLESENLTLYITVPNKPDPPVLTLLIETATVQEDEELVFAQDTYYSIVDQDSDLFDLIWNWYLNDALVPPITIDDKYNFAYRPEVTAEKDRTVTVKLEVIDGELDPVSIVWTVSVTNKNQAPHNVTVTSVSGKTTFNVGDAIQFSATAEDLDGDTLTYEWFLDEQEKVGTGPNLNLPDVKQGSHKISVEVTDTEGATTEANIQFTVKKDTEGTGEGGLSLMMMGIIALVVIIILVAVLVAVFMRKGGEDKTIGDIDPYGAEAEDTQLTEPEEPGPAEAEEPDKEEE